METDFRKLKLESSAELALAVQARDEAFEVRWQGTAGGRHRRRE